MNYLDKTGLTYVWSKLKAKLGLKQDTLVSGTNIKTINNNSILGAGNISTVVNSLGGNETTKAPSVSVVKNHSITVSATEPTEKTMLWIKADMTNHKILGFYILINNVYTEFTFDSNLTSNIEVNPTDTSNKNIWIETN